MSELRDRLGEALRQAAHWEGPPTRRTLTIHGGDALLDALLPVVAQAIAAAEQRGRAEVRAQVEALAVEWTEATCQTDGAPCSWHRVSAECGDELRAALAEPAPEDRK